jgi:hypothetical protein
VTIKFADQKIKEARQRIVALDRKLATLQRSLPKLSDPHLERDVRAKITQLGDERCKAFRDLLELLELADMPAEEMGWA